MDRYRLILVFLSVLVCAPSIAKEFPQLRMAATTSTKSSGLLDVLVPAFEQASGYKLKLFVVGTGRALRMGRLGEVGILLVHAPALERKFVEDGWGVERQPIMKNDFILVGPDADPANIRGMQDIGKALTRITETESGFVSRGDDSGTHKKELQCWSHIAIEPAGDWYFEAGMSMGNALKLASDKQYYTMVDRGTWLKAQAQTKLDLLVEGDPLLENPYTLIKVNPKRHAGVNVKGATAFSDWIRSNEGLQLITNLQVDGEQLFFLPDGLQE